MIKMEWSVKFWNLINYVLLDDGKNVMSLTLLILIVWKMLVVL